MTIFAKNILLGACEIANAEKDSRVLSSVLLESNGTVVARNQWGIFIAEPSDQRLAGVLRLPSECLSTHVCVNYDTLRNIVKAIPVDRTFKGRLEHIAIGQAPSEPGQLTYAYSTGKNIVTGNMRYTSPNKEIFLDWRAALETLMGKVNSTSLPSFIFNRKRLVSVVSAIETACKYDGEFAHILQKPAQNGLVWMAKNELYNQRVCMAFVLDSVKLASTDASFSDFPLPKKLPILRKIK